MARIRVSEEDIKTLELKAGLAYRILNHAVTTPEPSLVSSAECLYKHDLEAYLSRLTTSATTNFRHLKKGGKRAEKIEKYIVMCALVNNVLLSSNKSFGMQIIEDLKDGMGGLKAFIDAEDSPGPGEAEVFRQIQHKAAVLKAAGNYDLILKALEYVSEKYKK